MNFREFHTFSLGRTEFSEIACKDLYHALMAGLSHERIIEEIKV